MKINVKQIWEVAVSSDATIKEIKDIITDIRTLGDECYLVNIDGKLMMRRVSQ